jgi:hypothetical protein
VERLGITVPFPGGSLAAHRIRFADARVAGCTDAWSAAVDGTDGLAPRALAAAWKPGSHLGLAVAPAFTSGPALDHPVAPTRDILAFF